MTISRTHCLWCGLLAWSVSGIAWAAPPVPTEATQDLLDANPGMHAMAQGERLVALYGVPFATDADPQTTTDEFVAVFLAQNGDALGVEDPDLEFKDKINIRNNKFAVYTYTQEIENLPVHGSVVKVPVLLGATEKIGYVGTHLIPPPESALPNDVISANEAIAAVEDLPEFGELTIYQEAEKVVYEAWDGTLHRVWRFGGYDDDHGPHLFFVDTNTADLLAALDQMVEADVWGSVTGGATPGIEADGPENPPETVNLPGARVRILAGVEPACPSDDGTLVSEQFTNEQGQYSFAGVEFPVRVTSRLTGDWVTVDNCGGELSLHHCLGYLLLGQLDGAVACAEVTSGANPVLLPFNPSPYTEFDTAQVNAFLGVQKTHDWFKALQPTFTGIDRNLPCAANALLANACYFLSPECFVFGIAGEWFQEASANWAFSTVVSHEYGHFILDQFLELDYRELIYGAFHEGVADTVAALTWDTPFMGLGVYVERDPTFVRRLDEPDVRLDDCDSLPDWCPYCTKAHCRSLPFSGAFWDLRASIGDQATEELFADLLAITDGRLDQSVLVEVLMADDNDGDLSNGTPHETDILDSFETLHGWAYPQCQQEQNVVVKWVGPIPPYEEPEPNVDYFVNYDVCPPNVTLKTTEKDEVLVERWLVGRGTEANPGNLGTVTANWDGPAHDIVVEVGSATDADVNCADVNVIEIPAQSEGKYSSIVLDLDGNLLGRAQCYANNSDQGGRISGEVGGMAGRVFARAIGGAGDDPGTLDLGRGLKEMTVATIPAGSTLLGDELGETLDLSGTLHGTIHLRGDLSAVIRISGSNASTGNILIDGGMLGYLGDQLVIAGDMSGDIIADADEDEEGAILGEVIVNGLFTGNICGTNLSADESLPENIQLNLGDGATICGQAPECLTDLDCDQDPCDGIDTCVGGHCQNVLTDCNENGVEDICDIAAGTSQDCDQNNTPDECEGGAVPAQLVSASPVHEQSLWRTENNVIRLTFACNVTAPASGDVVIREMLDGGQHGEDLSDSFTFTLENTAGGFPRILKIHGEDSATLTHRKWYEITPTENWDDVDEFEVEYVVQAGDANNDGRVQFNDLAFINSGIPTDPAADDDRKDINGDGRVQFNDLAAANAHIPSDTVPRPEGH